MSEESESTVIASRDQVVKLLQKYLLGHEAGAASGDVRQQPLNERAEGRRAKARYNSPGPPDHRKKQKQVPQTKNAAFLQRPLSFRNYLLLNLFSNIAVFFKCSGER